jgi:putative tricarboxylic transport membrane protein
MGIVILFEELIKLINWQTLAVLFVSTSAGIVIGALPGLTATMGIALLTGLTYSIPTNLAIPILMGIYVGAIYGGSISAILINVPGTGSAAATALDGFPLAQKGEADKALFSTRIASFIGTVFGMVCLVGFAPLISKIAERYFASPEFFLLAIFGIVICGSLTATDKPIKGWIAGMLGLLISFVGIEEIHGFPRFTFGNPELLGGIAFIPAMIGVFGIPQILSTLRTSNPQFVVADMGKNNDRSPIWSEIPKNIKNILRSGLISVGIGAIPGVGEDIAAWMAYDRAKRASKKPELFGKGSYEGVIAAETGNNACIGGAIIPLLTLAVPGSPPAAVLLGALYLHGIRPGPMLTFEFPRFTYEMSAILLLASFALLICGVLLSRIMVTALKVKPAVLMPIVGALCAIGSYAIGIRLFDLHMMAIFGLVGYFLIEMGYPPAPLILGAILGPIADANFRRTLLSSNGSLLPFFTRPICIIFVLMIFLSIVTQFDFWNNLTKKIGREKARA